MHNKKKEEGNVASQTIQLALNCHGLAQGNKIHMGRDTTYCIKQGQMERNYLCLEV